jgi:hypothetical protein
MSAVFSVNCFEHTTRMQNSHKLVTLLAVLKTICFELHARLVARPSAESAITFQIQTDFRTR